MLILSRKRKQRIVLGPKREIIITVLKVGDSAVSIGIEAPPDLPIYREELLDEAERSNIESRVSKHNGGIEKVHSALAPISDSIRRTLPPSTNPNRRLAPSASKNSDFSRYPY